MVWQLFLPLVPTEPQESPLQGPPLCSASAAAAAQFSDPRHFAFLALFATFIFIAYVMLYAMAHLPTAMQLQRAVKTDSDASPPAETLGTVLPTMKTRSDLPLTASTAFQDS